LQRETARMVKIIALVGAALCVLLGLYYTMTRSDPLGGVLAGLTLAMTVVLGSLGHALHHSQAFL
jgi:Ca2+-transporting ATPase